MAPLIARSGQAGTHLPHLKSTLLKKAVPDALENLPKPRRSELKEFSKARPKITYKQKQTS